jgi:hypothetical protein
VLTDLRDIKHIAYIYIFSKKKPLGLVQFPIQGDWRVLKGIEGNFDL